MMEGDLVGFFQHVWTLGSTAQHLGYFGTSLRRREKLIILF